MSLSNWVIKQSRHAHIQIRVYTWPKEYDHIDETTVLLENDGSMSLAKIGEQLGELRTCYVSQ